MTALADRFAGIVGSARGVAPQQRATRAAREAAAVRAQVDALLADGQPDRALVALHDACVLARELPAVHRPLLGRVAAAYTDPVAEDRELTGVEMARGLGLDELFCDDTLRERTWPRRVRARARAEMTREFLQPALASGRLRISEATEAAENAWARAASFHFGRLASQHSVAQRSVEAVIGWTGCDLGEFDLPAAYRHTHPRHWRAAAQAHLDYLDHRAGGGGAAYLLTHWDRVAGR